MRSPRIVPEWVDGRLVNRRRPGKPLASVTTPDKWIDHLCALADRETGSRIQPAKTLQETTR